MNNDIKNAIDKGIKRGKRAQRANKIININVIVLAVIMVAFSISVNLSGALAASLKDVPILGDIVDFIRIGSGFKDAAVEGYFIEGGTILTDDEFEISIEGYYYSDKNMNIIVKIEGALCDEYIYSISDVELLDENMNKISGSSIGYGSMNIEEGYSTGNIVVNQREGVLPDMIQLRFNIRKEASSYTEPPVQNSDDFYPEYTYQYEGLKFELLKQFNEETTDFSIDQCIELSGLSINFKKLIITPTTMNLDFEIESETMQFYEFKSIYLKSDDKIYSRITNGVTRSGSVESGFSYYFDTCLFDEVKSIELVIDGIYALPKNNSSVMIDIEENKTLYSIDDQLIFTGVIDTGKYYKFNFIGGEGQQVWFKSINGEDIFSSEGSYRNEYTEYNLKIEKHLINKSVVEIDFYKYPNEIKLFKEITIE